MEGSFFNPELLRWALGLAIGTPVLILILSELNQRLEHQGSPLAKGFRQTRYMVVPLLALLLIMRYILGVAGSETSIRVVETLFWITAAYAALTLIRGLTEIGSANPASGLAKVPTLFFALIRGAMLALILSHTLSGIWGLDLSSLGTVVGFGSMAIALALQDTIGNIVSGFLLIADRPFRTGDWVVVDGSWMEVKEMTWRTTRLINWPDAGEVIIPNGALSNRKIVNYGQEGTPYQNTFIVTFSYEDPPNVVKKMLEELSYSVPGVTGDPYIITYGYSEIGIQYRLICTSDFWVSGTVWDVLNTQVFYMSKR